MRDALRVMILLALAAASHGHAACAGGGVQVQVLGSGGPIADDDRAASAYLVWVDGAARALIDAGSGAVLRFGQADADFADLDVIGLSHFHTDHAGDLPALLKSGSFTDRERDLWIAGPDGSRLFPGLDRFLEGLFDPDDGVYRYLSGFLDGTGGLPVLRRTQVPGSASTPVAVFESDDLVVDALPVPHGIVPALAYRVRTGDVTLVFGGDQNGTNPRFLEFARDAAVLVIHMAGPEGVRGPASRLHAQPGVIGEVAEAARADTLVLSHLMARSLRELDENVAIVRSRYAGRVVVAADMACIAPTPR